MNRLFRYRAHVRLRTSRLGFVVTTSVVAFRKTAEVVTTNLHLLSLGGILILAGGLRFYALGAKPLWLDEAFSVWVAAQPLAQAWAWLVRIDQHPPLYYTLLHFWITLWGPGEAAVRSLSALCSTLAVAVTFLIGGRIGGARMGLIAALLLAVAPFQVRFAQETRMYGLLTLTAALTFYFFVRVWQDPRAWSAPFGRGLIPLLQRKRERDTTNLATDLIWLGLSVCTALTMLTHNVAVLLPVSLLVAAAFLAWRRNRTYPDPTAQTRLNRRIFVRNTSLALLLTGVLWAFWLPAFIVQSQGVYEEFWISAPTLATVIDTLATFNSAHLPYQIPATEVFHGLMLIGVLAGVWRLRGYGWGWALLGLFALPWLGELLVSVWRPIFYDRTLIWTQVPYLLLLSAGIMALRYRPLQGIALALIVAFNGVSLHNYHTYFQKEEWDQAAAYVASHAEPDDVILFNATWVQIPFDYYFDRHDLPVARHGAPVDLFDAGVLEPKMTKADAPRLRQIVSEYDRVWLVYSHDWYTDPEGIIPRVLDSELRRTDLRHFYGLRVFLYEHR